MTNAVGDARFARERSTTAITYLFLLPDVSANARADLARRYVAKYVPQPPGGSVGVTGQAAAAGEQSDLVTRRLPAIELATLLLAALAVGIRFRALGAPVLTLITVAIADLIANHVVAWVGERAGFVVPREVEPIIVVLLFGVVTDYSIFSMSRCRALLADGADRLDAAREATRQMSPIVLVAGVTVIGATTTLLAAQLEFLRVFGPGLAVSVLIALAVSVTFVPAALALTGRALFWPKPPRGVTRDAVEEAPAQRPSRSRLVGFACQRPWTAVTGCAILLAAGTSGLVGLRLDNPVVRGLPSGNEVRGAYAQGAEGFAAGMLSPTVVVVTGHDVARRSAGLTALQREISRRRGVALVVGPSVRPVVAGTGRSRDFLFRPRLETDVRVEMPLTVSHAMNRAVARTLRV